MCAIGTVGIYKAPTDMAAHQQILARCGPGTENAAIVTGVSADESRVNLRIFPDQGDSFVLRGVSFDDDPINGSFTEGGATEAPPASRKAKDPLEKRS